MQPYQQRIQTAIADLKQGKMIILTDNPHRENEGDLIFPAEYVTADIINFMMRYCSGIICLPMTQAKMASLNLPLMVPANENGSSQGTPFTLSIEAREGVATGVSAKDRMTTILTAVKEGAVPADLVKPGHVFPLQAKEGGVLERAGHTEGSTDLMKIAGFKPAAVLCEVMNDDGSVARDEDLSRFAKQHQLSVIKEKFSGIEQVILEKQIAHHTQPPLVRMHSACLTGDLFNSTRCDCRAQLHYSLKRISEEGGLLIYMTQEGRGIGLFNKIKAYALQNKGYDTVEANLQLGLPADDRSYHIAANILRNRNLSAIRLMTNNPEKIKDLMKHGIVHVKREPMPVFHHAHNLPYLHTKKSRLNHYMTDDLFNAIPGDLI